MSDFNEHNQPRPGEPPEGRPSPADTPPTDAGGWKSSDDNHPPEHPQPPAGTGPAPQQPGRDYYGTPYAQNPGNVYTPQTRYDNQQRPYQPPQYNPYQYNANSGWQQPPQPARQPDKYEWKFEDYEKLDKGKPANRKRGSRGLVVFTVALLIVLSVGLVALAIVSLYSANNDLVEPTEETSQSEGAVTDGEAATSGSGELAINPTPDAADAPAAGGGRMSIPQVAEAVLPSVVGVIKYDNDQYFEISGYGSGIVMTADGYIITNAHVVAGGTGFKVQFTDGDAFDAEMIGFDSITDLAVLKIDATDLVPAQFGDSDAIKVGEAVVAIGNPAGMELASSVTAGIVSAVNREVRTSNYNMTFIQTDAAINPGNSGGALVNEFGQVIGINSSKIVASGYEGIGFAIPITSAKPIIDDIIANGRVTGRVMLGITCRVVDEVDARNYQIQMGLMIDSIDNAADLVAGGVQRGDILTHIDGERVYDLTEVRLILDKHKPGDTVKLTLYRRIGTKEQTFDVDTTLMESQ